MICNVPLTPEQKQRSQFNYCCYCGINGISYMCLGETVMVLLAVRLALPDWAVAAISAMLFFGFALLPLGKWMTARVGAARSQADFWVARNIVAVGVAMSVPWSLLGWRWLAGLAGPPISAWRGRRCRPALLCRQLRRGASELLTFIPARCGRIFWAYGYCEVFARCLRRWGSMAPDGTATV